MFDRFCVRFLISSQQSNAGKAYLELNDHTNAVNSFEMALDLGITAPEDAREARELLQIARTKKTLNSVTRNW